MRRLRLIAPLLVAALAGAAAAQAAPVRPSLGGPLHSSFVAFSNGTPICPNGLVCYSPGDLRQAYDFPARLGGAGQTILLVDAYGAPDLKQDLAGFDASYGLPAPPSLTVVQQRRAVPGTSGSGSTFGWEIETSLDVEYAHAMAPAARIVVAVARSDDSADLAELEREVLPAYPGAIVSQSFGLDESGPGSDPAFESVVQPLYWNALLQGGTILASSGDLGASNGTELEPGVTPSPMASFPASSPLVLAVGGTEGHPYPDGLWSNGHYGTEEAWNEPQFGGAGGGAPSTLFAAPPWQLGTTGIAGRAEPDVSYNAAIDGGVVVIISCPPDGQGGLGPCNPSRPLHGVVGGTSAGSPQWAAIVALANEARGRKGERPVGLVAPLLYAIAGDSRAYHHDFHDIVLGDNTLAGSSFGFAAQPGYDLATGLGTPDVSALVGDLAARSGDDGLDGLGAPSGGGSPDHGGRGHGDPGR